MSDEQSEVSSKNYQKTNDKNVQLNTNPQQQKNPSGKMALLRSMSGNIVKKGEKELELQDAKKLADTQSHSQHTLDFQRKSDVFPSSQQIEQNYSKTQTQFRIKSVKVSRKEDLNEAPTTIDLEADGTHMSSTQSLPVNRKQIFKNNKASTPTQLKQVIAKPSTAKRNIFQKETEDDFKKQKMSRLDKFNEECINNQKKQQAQNTWKQSFQNSSKKIDLAKQISEKEEKRESIVSEQQSESSVSQNDNLQASLKEQKLLQMQQEIPEIDSMKAPKMVNETLLEEIKEKYSAFKQYTAYIKNYEIMDQLQKSIGLLNCAQSYEKKYVIIFNQQKMKNEAKIHQLEEIFDVQEKSYQKQVKEQSEQINKLENQYSESINHNQRLQESLEEKQGIIEKQTEENYEKEQQIEEQSLLLEKQREELTQQSQQITKLEGQNEDSQRKMQSQEGILNEKEELIKNNQQQIEEKDSQIEELNNLLEMQMNEQQQSIEEINELKGGYDQSLKNNEQLQATLKENQQIIEKQRQQNEEKDKQIGESKSLLKQSMDQQKQLIDNLASSNSQFQKLQTLYNQSVQNNTNLENQVKEKDKQLIKEKQQNEEIIRNLESSNQQLLQQQKEAIQKIMNALSFNSDALSGEKLNQQIQSVLTQLNPKAEIQVNQIEFTKAHQIITQNRPNQKQKEVLQGKNDQLVQSYLNSLTNSQQSSRSSTAAIDPMHCLLALQGLYKQDGINTFITDQSIQSLEGSDKTYKTQQAYLQTGLHDQASYYSVKFNKETSLYQELVSSTANQNLNGFLESFKSRIAERVNSKNPMQDITIFKITFDHVPQVDFQINSKDYNREEFKRKMTLDDIGVSVSEKSLLEYAKLSVNMFSPSFNKKWTDEYKGKYEYRGQLKFYNIQNPEKQHYYFPVGYSGYALNIDRYGEDKSWISQNVDSKTWIVLFHGTSEKAVSGITKDNLRPGARNFYGGKKCRITNEIIKEGPNANVYLTDNMDEAESYAKTTSTYEGKKYKIIFQCRVNPKGVKSPQLKSIYYTVEDNINIRPYRILLKEV